MQAVLAAFVADPAGQDVQTLRPVVLAKVPREGHCRQVGMVGAAAYFPGTHEVQLVLAASDSDPAGHVVHTLHPLVPAKVPREGHDRQVGMVGGAAYLPGTHAVQLLLAASDSEPAGQELHVLSPCAFA